MSRGEDVVMREGQDDEDEGGPHGGVYRRSSPASVCSLT